jgi:hypothetical protein
MSHQMMLFLELYLNAYSLQPFYFSTIWGWLERGAFLLSAYRIDLESERKRLWNRQKEEALLSVTVTVVLVARAVNILGT